MPQPELNGQDNSVLSSGQWVKMSFNTPGIYKIDRNALSQMGFDPLEIDPRNISIYGYGGGMLPQSNQAPRISDLPENAIFVNGEEDGIFNSEDYILFYVDDIDPKSFNESEQTFHFEKNLYSSRNYYFLTVGSDQGKRIESKPDLGDNFPTIDTYNKLIYHENDIYNILGSGREWFGERFDNINTQSFELDLQNLDPTGSIKLSVDAMAQAFISSSLSVELDGNTLGELDFQPIPNARYTIKGNEQNELLETLGAGLSNNPALRFTYNRNGSTAALAYLNHFVLDVPTRLELADGMMPFRAHEALNNPISTFQIQGSTAETMVWDVTNPIEPLFQTSTSSGSTLSFGDFSDRLREYVAFNPADISGPDSFESVTNQDLHGMTTPEFLILTNEVFMAQARRLAEFRETQDGLDTEVIEFSKVYNEFASGRQDVSAIRDFIRYLHQKNDRLRYVLFFGKGSYDYKNRLEGNTNFAPTYEARNSLDPLASYSSDDFFGFLDEDEGEWIEASFGDHLLDIGIGRIPATSTEEAAIAIDKIINYQTSPAAFGDWRSRVLFVADDGDNNIHQRDADQLATLVDTSFTQFNVQKLYLDAFEQEQRPNGEFSPAAQEALLNAIDQGVLILNFTGHGAETGWMQERVLTLDIIDELSNENNLPLLVTATCEFGRNDDPAIVSGAEKIMFMENSGAIGLITTARPVFSSTNYDLNLALYGSILRDESGQYARLGDVIQYTKNNSLNGSSNRNFILLGDPSMRLAYPAKEITLQTINGQPFSTIEKDTLKALERMTISGQIEQAGLRDPSFDGEVSFVLLDKSIPSQTFGTESQVFEFTERKSVLFNGSATVEDGLFSIDFVIPRNINYDWGSGKISMYATNTIGDQDALGATTEFVIGGTAENLLQDNTPPTIIPYLNDTLSTAPFYAKPNATLLVKISDGNGINISQSGVGQEITATLNDSVTYELNSFFRTNQDDFTSGWVEFPLRNLPLGRNTMTIKAWDNYNNSQISTLEFIVNDESSTLITDIRNFPNPFVNTTTFSVAHNSAGERLSLTVEIFNQLGERVVSLENQIPDGKSIENISWDGRNGGGAKLDDGIYIYNVVLRSLDSGKSYSKRQKLVISN